MDLPFRLLQEELTPCYTKMSGATVCPQWSKFATQVLGPWDEKGYCPVLISAIGLQFHSANWLSKHNFDEWNLSAGPKTWYEPLSSEVPKSHSPNMLHFLVQTIQNWSSLGFLKMCGTKVEVEHVHGFSCSHYILRMIDSDRRFPCMPEGKKINIKFLAQMMSEEK